MIERYGRRNVPKMIRDIDAHRHAVASGDIELIQQTWDRIEPHIDYAYRSEIRQEVKK